MPALTRAQFGTFNSFCVRFQHAIWTSDTDWNGEIICEERKLFKRFCSTFFALTIMMMMVAMMMNMMPVLLPLLASILHDKERESAPLIPINGDRLFFPVSNNGGYIMTHFYSILWEKFNESSEKMKRSASNTNGCEWKLLECTLTDIEKPFSALIKKHLINSVIYNVHKQFSVELVMHYSWLWLSIKRVDEVDQHFCKNRTSLPPTLPFLNSMFAHIKTFFQQIGAVRLVLITSHFASCTH